MPWSTLDVASPEREYSPDSCPGGIYKPFMSDYRSERERARASLCRMLNVSYGAASTDRLDFFPASFADTPVLVFFHGGYWQELSKDDSSLPVSSARHHRYQEMTYHQQVLFERNRL
jgi:arylformamidase